MSWKHLQFKKLFSLIISFSELISFLNVTKAIPHRHSFITLTS